MKHSKKIAAILLAAVLAAGTYLTTVGAAAPASTPAGGEQLRADVALAQACIDLVYAQKDGDGASLVNRIESRNGLHALEHAEDIGLGSRTYSLVSIDD